MHPDPGVILTDYAIADALYHLRGAGFHVVAMKRTICAYKGERCYGFQARHGRFGREAITRAIKDNA
jgi:hypothetical protein